MKTRYAFMMLLSVLVLFSCEKTPQEQPDTEVKVTGVSLDKTELTLQEGETGTLLVTVSPDNASNKTISWSSSETSVATVQRGTVAALKEGSAIITATVQGISASCTVTVKAGPLKFNMASTDAAIYKAAGGSSKAIVSASDSWTVTSGENWLSISPKSGKAGDTEVELTTIGNAGGQSRTTQISFKIGEITRSFPIKQRADAFTRTKVASGRVTNCVKVRYSDTQFLSIYVVLPRPVSNFYQDISNFETLADVTEGKCPDGVNRYIWRDIIDSGFPASGDAVISESFSANVYRVTTDFNKMDDIPEYDPDSEECRKYLGKEDGGLIDPTHKKIASAANSLWAASKGSIIEYARKCHEWTYDNIQYGNMNTGLHTIEELMSTMTGDCGNFSSVFISLLRAKGIPARHIVMVHGKADEFHVRAEFYVPGYGWVPSDPTWGKKYFGVFEGDYIVMTQGINTVIRDYDGNDLTLDLLQTYALWHGYKGQRPTYTHSCLGL